MSEATKIITGADFIQGGPIVGHGMPPSVRVGTVTYRISNTPEDWAGATDATGKVGETDHTSGLSVPVRLGPGLRAHAGARPGPSGG